MDAVKRQRATLCDLLDSLSEEQWQAETLCAGWDAGDIAAHMLVRERDLWTAPALAIPPLQKVLTDRMARRKAAGRHALVDQLRDGPPRLMRWGLVGRVQVGEDYIHAEDVRRGGAAALPGADLQPDDGTADPEIDDLLWQAVGRFAPLTLGGVGVHGVVSMTDGGRTRAYRVGGRLARPADDGKADATLTGPAGELLLYVTGRSAHRVVVHGDRTLLDALDRAGRRV